MSHETLVTLHVVFAALSILGFALRGAGRLVDAAWVRARSVRVLPHLLDTLLFASGIWLLLRLSGAPLGQDWFRLKMVLLLGYIGLGFVVLRFARTASQRVAAYGAALLSAAGLAVLAVTRGSFLPL